MVVDVANCLQFHRVTRPTSPTAFLPSSPDFSPPLLPSGRFEVFFHPPAFPAFPRDSIFIIFQDSTPLLFPTISLASIVQQGWRFPTFPKTWKDLDLYPPWNFPDHFPSFFQRINGTSRGIDVSIYIYSATCVIRERKLGKKLCK